MIYDGIRVYMQNGKLDDVEIAHYINMLKDIYKKRELKRIAFSFGEDYIDLKYLFKEFPFERVWRITTSNKLIESAV